MTVSYQYEVASSTSGGFTRLLFMWRGSLYKLIYRELLLFLFAFGLLSALYRNAFTLEQKRFFEKTVVYCDSFIQMIPLSFILGFYVTHVADRWWKQYLALPTPDKVMNSLALYVGSNDERSRILRRTMIRYLNLTLILVLRSISTSVKRRFPTMDHLVEGGFMTSIELEMFSEVPLRSQLNTYWVPCSWLVSLLKDARSKNQITDPDGLKLIMEEVNEFRSKCGLLWSYDWISIPLVYTQVVTVATYSFFIAALVGRQKVSEPKSEIQMEIDKYLPVFTILQFLFYMGLLKVAEQLINPFGEDDEDFELNWLIDRHTKVSYLGVDVLLEKTPPLVKDKYFDDLNMVLPYTNAAAPFKTRTHRGSAYRIKVPKTQQKMYLPNVADEENDDKSQKNLVTSISNNNCSGVWRNIDIEQAADFNETVSSIQDQPVQNIKKFFKRTATLHLHNVQEKPFKIIRMQRWQHRSFNSTLDSYCSTRNIVSDSSSEIYPEIEKRIEDSEDFEKTRNGRKIRRSESCVDFSTRDLCNNLSNLGCNHLYSNQCKGVGLKLVSQDSAVYALHDNYSISNGEKSVKSVQQTCINCQENVYQKIKNIDCLSYKMNQQKFNYGGCKRCNNSNILSPFGTSLPNINLKSGLCQTSSSNDHDIESGNV